MKKQRFVIAGGGTGGHLYPGLALADTLKKQIPDAEIHFVGAKGGLEEKIIPQYGYPLHLLSVGRLHSSVGFFRRIKAALLLPVSFFQALFLYLSLRPRWVLGVGGFASGPFVFVAAIFGGKTAILEPNAYPGLTNRWLSKLVKHCFVVFDRAGKNFPSHKVVKVGLPVRMKKKPAQLRYDGRSPFRVLVFGGSQGARAVNKIVGEWVEGLNGRATEFEILHQIGKRDFSVWQQRYGEKFKKTLVYTEYIDNMPEKLDWADLVICRSGIGSVAEVAMSSRPAIFIPLPTAADNHQVKNAQVLVEKNAAKMIEEKDLTSKLLDETICSLKNNPSQLEEMMAQLKEIDYSRAPVEILEKLMGKPE